MILIGDGGSTKVDWRILDSNQVIFELETEGFNPFLNTTESIARILQTVKWPSGIKSIYYYGTGCSDQERIQSIKNAFSRQIQAQKIEVQHDLLGAARALCGHQKGIACILGTGSNSCLYDGKNIIDNIPSLGYIAGDEGSGNHLGKQLLKAYFYREMPKDLEAIFEAAYPGGRTEILGALYGTERPNAYLGQMAKLYKASEHPFLKDLAKSVFSTFVKRQVLKYKEVKQVPIHFTGSVAFHFKDWIGEVLIENDLRLGQFVQKPVDHLVQYHQRSNFD